jgi:flagellar protein FlgJ
MTIPPIGTSVPDVSRDPKLAKAVQQLQGVFVEQLFKAMRETVPDDGLMAGGSGEAMFTGLMDQHLADLVPAQWSTSLGDSLLRQFQSTHAPSSGTPETP